MDKTPADDTNELGTKCNMRPVHENKLFGKKSFRCRSLYELQVVHRELLRDIFGYGEDNVIRSEYCGLCDQRYKNIDLHMLTRHLELDPVHFEKPHKCRVTENCREAFLTPFNMSTHIAICHAKKWDMVEFLQISAYVKCTTGRASRPISYLHSRFHHSKHERNNKPEKDDLRPRWPGDTPLVYDIPIWETKKIIKKKGKKLHRDESDSTDGSESDASEVY